MMRTGAGRALGETYLEAVALVTRRLQLRSGRRPAPRSA